MAIQLVWFKKDLRTTDHLPLTRACETGPTLGLFVIEPEWLSSSEFDPCHFRFLRESLLELQKSLAEIKIPLLIEMGEVLTVLKRIHQQQNIEALYSHEETGLFWTFQRDIAVKKWARSESIPWHEFPQFGVQRGLRNRDLWVRERTRILVRDPLPAPRPVYQKQRAIELQHIPVETELGIGVSEKTQAQTGGRCFGQKTLDDFLESRGRYYSRSLSSPVKAFDGCSRISPYLTWGNLSLSEVLSKLHKKKQRLDLEREEASAWKWNLEQFESRLWWHCHFIQKLESEPELEFRNANRAFDGMREEDFDEKRFQAWCRGETGFPLIDACMRALKIHGWINFRMRAMLMSFASYQLWLHWRKPAQYLAQQFIDFEPGIHFSQVQMQSGVTGINTIRIYSPKKQTMDQDPGGEFIRQYCPELAALQMPDLAEPHKIPPLLAQSVDFRIGRDYPEPIVDPETSYQEAKKKIFDWSAKSEVKAKAKEVIHRHGSRKGRFFSKRR